MKTVHLVPSSDFDELIEVLGVLPDLEPKISELFLHIIDRLLKLVQFVPESNGVNPKGNSAATTNDINLVVGLSIPHEYRIFMTAVRTRNIQVAIKHAELL